MVLFMKGKLACMRFLVNQHFLKSKFTYVIALFKSSKLQNKIIIRPLHGVTSNNAKSKNKMTVNNFRWLWYWLALLLTPYGSLQSNHWLDCVKSKSLKGRHSKQKVPLYICGSMPNWHYQSAVVFSFYFAYSSQGDDHQALYTLATVDCKSQ